jgi:hypothetical protein
MHISRACPRLRSSAGPSCRRLHRTLVETGGYLIAGKFDLYRRDVPYSGFVAAFASLAHQLLTESNDRLARWRAELLERLGTLASVAVELIPDLGFVLGTIPAAPALGPAETQARLGLTVQRLVTACAHWEHPLVLVLDDLQWADPGSRYLLEELLLARRRRALLLIGIFRDNELDAAHPMGSLLARLEREQVPVTHISLGPLDLEASAQMLSDALGRPLKETHTLVSCIARKIGSSPLLIRQFVLHLHTQGLIRFEHPHGWSWNDDDVAAADIPDDAVALMVAKLESLSERPLAVIQLASCVGDEFAAELLSQLSGEPEAELAAPLFELTEEGLISPSPSGFRFVHDRVREAAQALLGVDQRLYLHQRAGLLLLERTPEAELPERAFEIADHLNHALERLSAEQRFQALRVNLAAGQRALRAGAAVTAKSYLDVAHRLHEESHWEKAPQLAFDVFWNAAEAAYQTVDLPRALELLDGIERHALDPMRRAQVLGKRIAVESIQDRRFAIDTLLAGLRSFGIRWSRQPTWLGTRLAIARLDFMLRGPLDERAFPRRARLDPSWAAPALLLRAGGAAMVGSSSRLPCLAAMYALRMYRRFGPLGGPGFAFAAYAAFRLAVLGHARGAERYGQAAEFWMERMPNAVLGVRARFNLQAYVHPWIRARRSVLEPLQRTADAAREIGDIEYAYLSDYQHAEYSALVGEPIAVVLERLQWIAERSGARRSNYVALQQHAYRLLQEPPNEDALRELTAQALAPDRANPIHRYTQVHVVLVLTLAGDYVRAGDLAEALAPALDTVGAPSVHLADIAMCRGLCAFIRSESARERRVWRKIARGALCKLRTWAQLGPDFRHMHRLLEAEHARVRGDAAGTLRHYHEAAQLATSQRHTHHAALIQERLAEFLRASRRLSEASVALREALLQYKQWGARLKIDQLKSRREELL